MLHAIHFYRGSRRLHLMGIPLLPRCIDLMSRVICACWVPHTAAIGKRVVLGYGGLGIVIHSDATIEDGVQIGQHVTIGGTATRFGTPYIERDAYIGAGAKILGPVRIGRGAVIGANAVVIGDVPAGAVAVGVPARIVKTGVDVEKFLVHRRAVTDNEAL